MEKCQEIIIWSFVTVAVHMVILTDFWSANRFHKIQAKSKKLYNLLSHSDEQKAEFQNIPSNPLSWISVLSTDHARCHGVANKKWTRERVWIVFQTRLFRPFSA